VYGFDDADEFNTYYGGALGVEWYQVNPLRPERTAACAYDNGFERTTGGAAALRWTGGVAIRYAF
jgi:hypothetical protein